MTINRHSLQDFLLTNKCGRQLNSIYSYEELIDEIEMAIEDGIETITIMNSYEQEIELTIKDILG